MHKLWLLALVLGMTLVGCHSNPKAVAEPVEFSLDKEFSLTGGEEATIGGEKLRLRFTEVLEDSRCPTQVECVWTGQARIAVLVQPQGREPTTVELNTNPAPGQNVQTAQVGEYTVSLQSLDPYPQTIDESTALDQYRATLVVHKA
ncbi:hypothetical protein [Mycobacterium sp.]|uniref:hypothetical protein n=1 Tax=Mycobacterium sp. TaxID=1785 RepID=UPI002D828617|nr:hypothetical protein [Mycobacterium sp.]